MEFAGIEESNYAEVARIYLEGIRTGMATFETQVPDWQAWNKAHHEFGRIALVDQNRMLAWGALTPVSQRLCLPGRSGDQCLCCRKCPRKGPGKGSITGTHPHCRTK